MATIIDRLMHNEVARADWRELFALPNSQVIAYLPGVHASKLPLVSNDMIVIELILDAHASTGKIVHDCKKIATCIEGEFRDEISGVTVKPDKTMHWQADTTHCLTANVKSRILLQFNRK